MRLQKIFLDVAAAVRALRRHGIHQALRDIPKRRDPARVYRLRTPGHFLVALLRHFDGDVAIGALVDDFESMEARMAKEVQRADISPLGGPVEDSAVIVVVEVVL